MQPKQPMPPVGDHALFADVREVLQNVAYCWDKLEAMHKIWGKWGRLAFRPTGYIHIYIYIYTYVSARFGYCGGKRIARVSYHMLTSVIS